MTDEERKALVERREAQACIDLEYEADLYAMAGNFSQASSIMRQVNRRRAQITGQYGGTCPNVLRELALSFLGDSHE